MYNKTFYEIIKERGLYNHADNVMRYYDKSQGIIITEFLDEDYDTNIFIELPCLHEFEGLVWCFFWDSLSDEERKIADNRTTRYITRDYLYETGLISVYDKALEDATKYIYDKWERVNHITLDWENIVID